MSDFLLDTNVVSELICRRPNSRVIDWLDSQPKESLYLSVVSVGELWRGFVLAPEARRAQLEQWFERELLPRVEPRVLPVTQSIAKRWGILDADARLRRLTLNAGDGMIAATALEHALVVATRNVRDFEHLGAPILNPWG